ncbi:uncharacterized protein PGTG_00324 [Puccinia graminis f. sp. tritici CRL 75-36-700-3]|uniref:Peptidase S9A N-terminal domain-containing protein n=1 Tax=Puccinia graminis f. sp. tritici (strain CRL 75-36-700-3 / race SCCL) TaxID=418459 RepID=E3JQ78_PUCGT|nr:uncharacterized protein PGTG_00324 [Puccinia graminis f. sp. tritici CRL 75-36-700-3]EFP74368.2 hypothetical protein PGTG_00324 [Puccinia graminis f. sp. tritici CRL 75-36-700-3]
MSWYEYPLVGRNPSRQEEVFQSKQNGSVTVPDPYSWLHEPPKQSNALKRATDPKQPAGKLFLDPNLFSINGTTALSFSATSESGIYMAYGVSRSGSNSQTIYVRRTDSPHTKSAADGGKRGKDTVVAGRCTYPPACREVYIPTSSLGGIPPGKLVYIPACWKGFLPTSWCVHTSLSEGIPSDELVYIPSRREGFLPTRGYSSQLVGRNPSRSPGGIPPGKLVCTPARQEEHLPASCLPGGIPPGGVASLGTGYPLGYPDICQVWVEKQPSKAKSAPAGGYPLVLAGIHQRIADICNGLSPPISSHGLGLGRF